MLHDDVRTLRGADLPPIDVIVGSPPCQDASSANLRGRGAAGHRTGLWEDFARLVGECRPVWCCAENVFGLSYRGVDRWLGDLEALGYACWPLDLGAENVGAPHRRRRLWVVGVDADRQGQSRGAVNGEVAGLVGPSAWDQPWSAVASGFLGVADGLPDSLARHARAALGDAIVPQVAYQIVRAMSAMFPDARRVLDLFCGAVGGWTYACTWAGLEVVAACEIDPWRREVYAAVHHSPGTGA